MRRAKRGVTTLLLVLGVAVLAAAAWIPLKAELAQYLLVHAWQRARSGDTDAKPWPWADTRPVARLEFEDQAAHGNSVIAGHRDTYFRILERLRRGDRIAVDTVAGQRTEYVVSSARVVREDQTEILRQDGPTRLTLITCFPFDAVRPGGSRRYVVVAKVAEGHR